MKTDKQTREKRIIERDNLKPNVVFVDPPRKGLDKKTIGVLQELEPSKIIYISCNNVTRLIDVRCYITCIFYAENKSCGERLLFCWHTPI